MMKPLLVYLLEVLFCSGALLGFYRLLLVRRVAFRHCRQYLVAAVVLSVFIPALDIPLYPARMLYTLPLIAVENSAAEMPLPAAETPVAGVVRLVMASPDWPNAAYIAVCALYLLTAAVSLVILFIRIVSIVRLRRQSRLTACGKYMLAENPSVVAPFSFLSTVFLGSDCAGRSRDIVLCHEMSHVMHRHSAERIVVELVRCLFWFNPFMWIASRWLAEVQEWEADRDVLDSGYDLTEYRTIIFCQLFGYNPDIASGLNHSLTKNRFVMMTQFRKSKFTLLRLGAAIPVVAGMMLLCSFTVHTSEPSAVAMSSLPDSVQVIPGLDKLTSTPYHTSMFCFRLPAGAQTLEYKYFEYLPVNDALYKYAKEDGIERVTNLKGKNIIDWARNHYFVQLRNPVFVVDGVRMDKDAVSVYCSQKFKADEEVFAGCPIVIYTGAEVSNLLGDPTVDGLVVIASPTVH